MVATKTLKSKSKSNSCVTHKNNSSLHFLILMFYLFFIFFIFHFIYLSFYLFYFFNLLIGVVVVGCYAWVVVEVIVVVIQKIKRIGLILIFSLFPLRWSFFFLCDQLCHQIRFAHCGASNSQKFLILQQLIPSLFQFLQLILLIRIHQPFRNIDYSMNLMKFDQIAWISKKRRT